MKRISKILLLCLVASHGVLAQDLYESPDDNRWSFTFQLDNDVLLGNFSDQDYTNGLHLAATYRLPRNPSSPIESAMLNFTGGSAESPLHALTNLDPSSVELDIGLSLTQLMFTPTNRRALVAPQGQRPFAGWLGLGVATHAKSENAISSVALTLGITGEESLADQAQNTVHDLIGVPKFRGWPSQVPTEVTLNLHVDRKWRYSWMDPLKYIDGYFEYGALVGNFRTAAYAGSLVRIGFNLPESYPTPRLDIASTSHRLFTKKKGHDIDWSLYAFAGARLHGVLHDITLDGPLFRDHRQSVNSEPIVGELTYGWGARYKGLEAILSTSIRTDEFVGQRKNHQYGSLMFRCSF